MMVTRSTPIRIRALGVLTTALMAVSIASALAQADPGGNPGNQTAVCCALPPLSETAEEAAALLTGTWHVPDADFALTYTHGAPGEFHLVMGSSWSVPLARVQGIWRMLGAEIHPTDPPHLFFRVEHVPTHWSPDSVCGTGSCESWVRQLTIRDLDAADRMTDENGLEFLRRD